jgi:hypothetical protein
MKVATRIIKGGALLAEARQFVDGWGGNLTSVGNLVVFRSGNLLGKRSRSRTEDALAVLRQRLVEPGPEVVRTLKIFNDAVWYEAAHNDDLLAYTAAEILNGLRGQEWVKVTVEDVEQALLEAPPTPIVKEWADDTRHRVVHGLLSASWKQIGRGSCAFRRQARPSALTGASMDWRR